MKLARASCENVCRGSIGAVQLQPALDCASIEASLNDCGCGVLITVVNDCSGELSLTGNDLTAKAKRRAW